MTGFDPDRPRPRGLLSAAYRARLDKAEQKPAGEDAAVKTNSGDERRKAKRKEATARVLKARNAMDRGEIPRTDLARLHEVYMMPRRKRGRRRKASPE